MYSKVIASEHTRVQVFGDLHGLNKWKQYLDLSADRIIFLGDYVDSHSGLHSEDIIVNFMEVLHLKIMHPEKVVLLWGNHDVAYFKPNIFCCSGHRKDDETSLTTLFRQNYELFQMAHQEHNWLFTHAGLTKPFWQNVLQGNGTNYASVINKAFLLNFGLFKIASYYRGGTGYYGSTLWSDEKDFDYDCNWPDNLNQIIGHNPVPRITVREHNNSQLVLMDTWTYYAGNEAVYEFRIKPECVAVQ